MGEDKIHWGMEKDGTIFGFRFPIFHIYEGKKGEWILVYRRNPKVEIREFTLNSIHQCKMMANKMLKL